MRTYSAGLALCWLAALAVAAPPAAGDNTPPTADEVLAGLKAFWQKTALPDGSFRPGIDPDYKGMSDSAASDMAPVTYAVTLHRTFGWKPPHEAKTIEFLQSRQQKDGAFVNVGGTSDPKTTLARVYNTTQGLVALHALESKPRHDPIPVFEEILKQDYKTLPAYCTSFFPLAYLAAGKKIPAELDKKIRAEMPQTPDGYVFNHVASTFHAAHFYRLVGAETPKAPEMLKRIMREQKPDGSWALNPPARDRHGCFDAVFTLHQLGGKDPECKKAIQKAVDWVLTCRNADGGFGHYPGSPSDADAVYFHVGVLVMGGFLKPADPLPPDPHLLSWGHLMPLP
jgi:geranylgeranyl transferase type-2 subunit beta